MFFENKDHILMTYFASIMRFQIYQNLSDFFDRFICLIKFRLFLVSLFLFIIKVKSDLLSNSYAVASYFIDFYTLT